MAKSWDIQPRKKVQPAPQAPAPSHTPAPMQRARPAAADIAARPRIEQSHTEPMVRRSALKKRKPQDERQRPEPVKATPVRRERVPQGKERQPLKERRKKARRLRRRVGAVLIFILLIVLEACLWLPALRIQQVYASGPHADGIPQAALSSLWGTYYYVLPKNSFLFISEGDIRGAIQRAYPDIAAVTVKRTALNAITVVGIPRETAFLWCGVSPDTITISDASTTPNGVPCYDTDSLGYVFASENANDAGLLKVYGSLDTNTTNVLGARIAGATYIPNVLEFLKIVRSLGVSITSIVLRGDEADLYTPQQTRITYVLGQETMAAQLASSAFPTLSMNDGSLDYVDLRFNGKVYFKKTGSSQASSTPQ